MEWKELKRYDLVTFFFGVGKKVMKIDGLFDRLDSGGNPIFLATSDGSANNMAFDKSVATMPLLLKRPGITTDFFKLKEQIKKERMEEISNEIRMVQDKMLKIANGEFNVSLAEILDKEYLNDIDF